MATLFAFSVGAHELHEVTVGGARVRHRGKAGVHCAVAVDCGGILGGVRPNVFDIGAGVHEKHMVSVRLIAQQLIDGGASYIDVIIDGRYAFRQNW